MIGIFAFPALLPEFVGEWGLSNTQAGWISGIYFAGYTLSVSVLASLTDRIDARRIYMVFATVGALATACFGFFAQGFWTAMCFRIIGGIGLAGTFVPGLKALVDRIADEKGQARAISFYTAFFSLGTSLSFFANGQIGALFGWRQAFILSALGPVLALIISFIFLKPVPRIAREKTVPSLLDFRPVFRNRKALAYILAYTAHTWELFAYRSWVVAFLTFSLGLQQSVREYWTPSTIAALTGIIAMWASIGGAELSIRFGRRRIITLIMTGSALFAVSIGFTAGNSYPLVAALCIVYALFVQGESAALHVGTVLTAIPDRRGSTMAAQSVLGFAGASAGPIVFGIVLDVTGGGQSILSWGMSFISMGIVVAMGPLFLAFFNRTETIRPLPDKS